MLLSKHRWTAIAGAATMAALFAASAGPAAASQTAVSLSGPLPGDLHYFSTYGTGLVNPAVLVGFNPQPDPPGTPPTTVDLVNPLAPSITQPGAGEFTILFGMHGASAGDPYSLVSPAGAPNSDGITSFFMTGDGSVFKVSFDISGYQGGWVGFNPQPDPPGDWADGTVGYAFQGDPMVTWTVDIGSFDANGAFVGQGLLGFSEVPEPFTAALLLAALPGLAATRRRRAA